MIIKIVTETLTLTHSRQFCTQTRCRSVHAHAFTAGQKNCGKSGLGRQSPWVGGQDYKKPPAQGSNQIAGFGEFRPLTNLEKNTYFYSLSSSLLGAVLLASSPQLICARSFLARILPPLVLL